MESSGVQPVAVNEYFWESFGGLRCWTIRFGLELLRITLWKLGLASSGQCNPLVLIAHLATPYDIRLAELHPVCGAEA